MLFLHCSVLTKISLKKEKDLETQTSPFHLVLGLGQELWMLPWSLWAVCAPAWSIPLFQEEGHSSQNASRGIAVLESWDKRIIQDRKSVV